MLKTHISVVIPVKNGGPEFELCLQAVKSSDYKDYEVIVVNDCSADDTVNIARKYGAKIVNTTDQEGCANSSIGPAGARNLGVAHATGEIIYFIDSDVLIQKSNLRQVADIFQSTGDIDAVFGTYDDSPACETFISQYRNLLHTYIHQISLVDSETFWTGCGAIRKDVFLKMGGFDLKTFRLPSIEDIDLGYRMKDAGYHTRLDKDLRVKHLKKWTFSNMLKTDIFHRAIPWARLLLKRKCIPNDLNIQTHHRASGALVVVIFSMFFLVLLNLIVSAVYLQLSGQEYTYFGIPTVVGIVLFSILLIAGVLVLNRNFYAYLYTTKGLFFTVRAIPLHFFYYFYSTITFAIFLIDYYFPPFRWLRIKTGITMKLVEEDDRDSIARSSDASNQASL